MEGGTTIVNLPRLRTKKRERTMGGGFHMSREYASKERILTAGSKNIGIQEKEKKKLSKEKIKMKKK